jgi:hypothetical protein
MKRIVLILTLLFLFTASVGVASAAPLNDILVRAGETIDRDLVVPGGNLIIEAGAVVNGSVTVFGGNAVIAGDVTGDLASFGGNVSLSGVAQGDVALFGGNLTVDETAVIGGDCVMMGGNLRGEGRESVTCAAFGGLPSFSAIFSASPPPSRPPSFAARLGYFFRDMAELFSRALLLSIAALIIAAVIPDQLNRVSHTVTQRPLASGFVGILTGIAVPSLLILLLLISTLLIIVCIGLLGFPLALLILLALVAATVMGWVAIGHLVGKKVLGLLKMEQPSLIATAVVGTALLTLGVGFIKFLPLGGFFSWLLLWGLASIGLGATALTQFGRHDYPTVDRPRPRRKMEDILGEDEVEDIPVHKM